MESLQTRLTGPIAERKNGTLSPVICFLTSNLQLIVVSDETNEQDATVVGTVASRTACFAFPQADFVYHILLEDYGTLFLFTFGNKFEFEDEVAVVGGTGCFADASGMVSIGRYYNLEGVNL